MSFDELPPGSVPPSQPGIEQASDAAQETSGQDAPPAAGTRRRRTRTAGTAAASESVPAEQVSETPARPGRRARNVPVSDTAVSAPESAAETPAEAVEETVTPVRARRTRKREIPAAAPEALASDSLPPAPEAAPDIAPSAPIIAPLPMPAAPALPPSRRRRSMRKAASEGVVQDSAASPATGDSDSEPAIAPASVPDETLSPTPAAVPPARRRRSSADRRGIQPAAPVADAAEPEPPVVPGVTESPAEPASQTDRQNRRRKGARNRRGQSADLPTSEAPAPVESAAPAALPESADDQDLDAGGKNRRRRGRRAGKELPVSAESAEAVAPEPVVEEIPTEDVYLVPADLDVSTGSHLVLRNGMPEIQINGVTYPPVLFFGNAEDAANLERIVREVKQAAGAGIHLHSTLIELPCPHLESSTALEDAAARLTAIAEADPEGYVIPRVVILPARGWKRRHPQQVALYADGSSGDPSIGSDLFWTEAAEALTTLVQYLSNNQIGARIAGYHLERGEWFQPVSLGYDRCPANRDCFRDWLKRKYKNNHILLRAAWYDGDVQFSNADIPALSTKPQANRAFYEPRRDRATIDYHEYTSEITAKRLISLATAVKRAAGHKALVSLCYGYTFEFGHTFSGHLALGIIEDSQAIDLICGPPSYRDRLPGGAASMPAPIDSPALHGKLWLSEDDTKTYLAPEAQDPEDFNPRLATPEATTAAQQRALGRAISHSSGVGFMDLWGEGWLDNEDIWSQLGAFVSRYKNQLASRKQPRVPEVIALIDERSIAHVQKGEQFLRRIVAEARNSLQAAGISFGVYLQSDLLSPAFPDSARLYLFLTPYRLTKEQRNAITEKLQNQNKTLVWFYAPGSCEERPQIGGASEESAAGVIGIALRSQEWNSEVGSRIVDTHHPLTERLNGREIGTRERLNPSYYVDDAEASVLAEYHGSGLPSIAVKNQGTWKSVFVGDPVMPLDLLRGICRYAGVHVWTPQGEDIVDIGCGHVTIHAVRDGNKTIRLPESMGLYSVTDSRHIAEETREYRFFMKRGETHTFCVGNAERFETFGLPNVQKSQTTPRAFAPIPPPPPDRDVRRELPGKPRPQSSDIETLEAVLNMDISVLEGVELEPLPDEPIDFVYLDPNTDPGEVFAEDPEVAGEMVAGGRRRRRRGGRGRGRRRQGEGGPGGDGSGDDGGGAWRSGAGDSA
jgi:hypothetical protein